MGIEIGIVADFDRASLSHRATAASLQHSAKALGLDLRAQWIGTDELGSARNAPTVLKKFDALWIGPGSPYRDMDGALNAIHFARTEGLPMLGTCGGFQHTIIEAARNILGLREADHEETSPEARTLFITKLVCSLAGRTMDIALEPGTQLRKIYGDAASVQEEYLCNFGVNPAMIASIKSAGLTIAASDAEGEVRAFELSGHPFCFGTLFLPQHRSTSEKPHPLITAFVQAASDLASRAGR